VSFSICLGDATDTHLAYVPGLAMTPNAWSVLSGYHHFSHFFKLKQINIENNSKENTTTWQFN
jgi:hypothetical protein